MMLRQVDWSLRHHPGTRATPDGVLDATAGALRPLGPSGRGLDVCCGTGAGMRVLRFLCRGPVTGVDFSAGMLAQARSAHLDCHQVPLAIGARRLLELPAIGVRAGSR